CGVGVFLLALAVVLICYLGFAEKPWDLLPEIEERIEAGKRPTLGQDIAVGCYWAAAINLALTLGLLSMAWLWRRPTEFSASCERFALGAGARWAFALGLILAVVLGGALRINLARGSLWWDEMWSVKQVMVGKYVPEEANPQDQEYVPASLGRAAWYYLKPTNHVIASVLSNVSVSLWQGAGSRGPEEFSDFAVRAPVFAAALFSILGIGILLRSWGYPLAGVVAALLLALHPWHIRYGIDARSYAYTVLLSVTGALALTWLYRARGRSWLPWIALGVNQFLLVWGFLPDLWIAAGFGASAVVLLWSRSVSRRERVNAMARLVFVNALAAMAFIQMFAPSFMQMRRWVAQESSRIGHLLDPALFRETVAQLLTGMHWEIGGGAMAQGLPSLRTAMAAAPVLSWGVLLVMGVIFFLGLGHVVARRRLLGVILLSVLAAGLIFMAMAAGLELLFYERFMIYLLVPLVAGVALGLDRLGRGPGTGGGAPRSFARRILPAAIFLLLFTGFLRTQIRVLLERPYAPMREVAGILLEEGERGDPMILGYGLGGQIMRVYHRGIRFVTSLSELEAALTEASQGGRGAVLFYGYDAFNRALMADGFALIDDGDNFEEIASFSGIEPEFYFRVLRWKGGASAVDGKN
ncbi:MAG: hypothetical protein ACC661_08695, partial [Verrucomicrobiales bacterium]